MAQRITAWTQITSMFSPVHREGHKFLLAGAGITLILFTLWTPLGWTGALITASLAFFFRDPDRFIPLGESLVVSPADGIVIGIENANPPEELALGAEASYRRISIFLSLFDVHVIRSPVSAGISVSIHTVGLFHHANSVEAASQNERHGLMLEMEAGPKIPLVMVAGCIARRIVTPAKPGDRFAAGDRIGFIRFGSRVDVYLPESWALLVAEGQRMIGGETVLADLSLGPGQRAARRI